MKEIKVQTDIRLKATNRVMKTKALKMANRRPADERAPAM